MDGLLSFIKDSGFVGWCIMFVGFASLAIMIERAYVLYKKYGMNFEEFMNRIQTSVLAKKYDESLVLCSQISDKPFANAFKTILEKADRDDNSIYQAHDIAMSETIPQFTKKLHYLSMFANVATLMGLLGTIHGLILSFQAVATADPAQKQALLAHGIAVSMYTTALGLVVAIPAMVVYSFLVSRQNYLVDQLTEKCGKLVDLLTSSQTPSLTRQTVYPDQKDQQAPQKQAPPNSVKAS